MNTFGNLMKYFCLVWEQHYIILYQILHFVALCHGTATHPEAIVMILEAGVTIRDTKNPSWSNINPYRHRTALQSS